MKGPKGIVCFVVVAPNIEGKILQYYKFVAQFCIFAKVWSMFWEMDQVALYGREMWTTMFKNLFFPH